MRRLTMLVVHQLVLAIRSSIEFDSFRLHSMLRSDCEIHKSTVEEKKIQLDKDLSFTGATNEAKLGIVRVVTMLIMKTKKNNYRIHVNERQNL